MTATTSPDRPDPTRSGAVWVTGMGAFLLLAAAAVFTAVRWDQIPDAAKLGALVAATGACLVASRSLRQTLPASAGALLHLGAFLVPIDVAAIGVNAGLDWSTLLLAEGLVAAATFGWAAATERSVVLRWAFGASVVALAGGVGATTAIPAGLVLAAFAVAALAALQHDEATGWAAVAGIAPLLTFADQAALPGVVIFERLGLVGSQPRAAAVVSGVASAGVLAVVGRRRDDVGLALLGALVAAVGVAASWTGLGREGGDMMIALAVGFLVVEVAAFLTREDAFWRQPTSILARAAEVGAGVGTALTLATIVLMPVFGNGEGEGRGALTTAVLGLGWVAVELRTGRGRLGSTVGVATAVVGTVALATGSPSATAVALTAVAAAAVLLPRLPATATTSAADSTSPATGVRKEPGTGPFAPRFAGVGAMWTGTHRPGAHLVAVGAALAAPLMASGTVATVLVGIAGAVILTEAAVRRSHSVDPTDAARANDAESWAWVLGLLALVPGAIAVGVAASTAPVALTLVGGAAVATALAAQADRARTATAQLPLGTLARGAALSVLAGTAELPVVEIGVVAVAVAALSALDAVRLQRPPVALGAAVALPVAIGSLAHAAGLSLTSTGVALTVGAAVLAGLGSQLGRRWALPVTAAVGLAISGGLVLASADPTALADAVIVSGGIGLAAAISAGRLDGVYLGGVVVTSGTWLRLADGEVGASEPYLAPVCALLLIAGLRARSIGTSSWIAYGPVVGLLGGSALLERMAGGAGWHAVVAGAVGVLAVAAGGARRLAAPLLLGSGLLVGLVGFETLAITSSFPTWVWLGLGGGALLGAGVAMERRDLGPVETGRRLVDVVSDRYA